MKVIKTGLDGVVIVEPQVFEDHRGFFLEAYQQAHYRQAGIPGPFVQDNRSRSCYGTVRGLHYQLQHPQGKLIYVVRGEVFDVAVDLRLESATFGRWVGVVLSETNQRQLYIPPGFAHGFCVLSELADLIYKCTDYYHPHDERTICWDDSKLAISWQIDNPIVSEKDRRGTAFASAECFSIADCCHGQMEDSDHESGGDRRGRPIGPRVLQTTRPSSNTPSATKL